MIFEGIANLIGGISANKKHKEYAKMLQGLSMTMPTAITDAETLYKGNASQGLPGYETYMADIESLLPSTVNVGREVVDNPSQLLDMVAKASATAGSKIRDLGIEDADAKLKNEVALANFLSSVKAPMQNDIQMFDIQKKVAGQQEKMAGAAELWKGIGNFGGTLDSAATAIFSAGGGNLMKGLTSMFGSGG